MAEKNEKINVYDFPLHYCTQEQNSIPYFSLMVWQCKGTSLSRKIVEIQKFCYHGNAISHYSPLLQMAILLTPDAMKFTKYANKEEILGLVLKSLRATWWMKEKKNNTDQARTKPATQTYVSVSSDTTTRQCSNHQKIYKRGSRWFSLLLNRKVNQGVL